MRVSLLVFVSAACALTAALETKLADDDDAAAAAGRTLRPQGVIRLFRPAGDASSQRQAADSASSNVASATGIGSDVQSSLGPVTSDPATAESGAGVSVGRRGRARLPQPRRRRGAPSRRERAVARRPCR